MPASSAGRLQLEPFLRSLAIPPSVCGGAVVAAAGVDGDRAVSIHGRYWRSDTVRNRSEFWPPPRPSETPSCRSKETSRNIRQPPSQLPWQLRPHYQGLSDPPASDCASAVIRKMIPWPNAPRDHPSNAWHCSVCLSFRGAVCAVTVMLVRQSAAAWFEQERFFGRENDLQNDKFRERRPHAASTRQAEATCE